MKVVKSLVYIFGIYIFLSQVATCQSIMNKKNWKGRHGFQDDEDHYGYHYHGGEHEFHTKAEFENADYIPSDILSDLERFEHHDEIRCSSKYLPCTEWRVESTSCLSFSDMGLVCNKSMSFTVYVCVGSNKQCIKKDFRYCRNESTCTGSWGKWVTIKDKCLKNCTHTRYRNCFPRRPNIIAPVCSNPNTKKEYGSISCAAEECKAPRGNVSPTNNHSSFPLVFGILFGLSVILLCLFLFIRWRRQKEGNRNNSENEENMHTESHSFVLTSWREFSKKYLPRRRQTVATVTDEGLNKDEGIYVDIVKENKIETSRNFHVESLQKQHNHLGPQTSLPLIFNSQSNDPMHSRRSSGSSNYYTPPGPFIERPRSDTGSSSGYAFVGPSDIYVDMKNLPDSPRFKSKTITHYPVNSPNYTRTSSEPMGHKYFISTRRVSKQTTFRKHGVAARVSRRKSKKDNQKYRKAVKQRVLETEDVNGYMIPFSPAINSTVEIQESQYYDLAPGFSTSSLTTRMPRNGEGPSTLKNYKNSDV